MTVLGGVRVLDLGRYIAGPYCAALLGYLGAEVIRVERPGGGEDRTIAPLFDRGDGTPGEGALFMQTACGKKSITLNLSTDAGRQVLAKLVQSCDVVVANMPPLALRKLALDWDTFSASHPRGILVTQTSFGASGPDQDKGGFDGIGQAMSGAMYLSGTPGHPVKAAAPYVDYSTATMAAFGTLAALMQRDKTDLGHHVETSLLGTALAAMNAHLIEQSVTQKNRVGTGNRVQTSAPSDVFETRDGHVLVHTVGGGLFKRWARLVGRPELPADDRFATDQARGDARDALCAIMADWCKDKSTQQALSELETAGVPAGPVLSLQQALDHPQAEAMQFFKAVDFPGLSEPAPVADLPVHFSSLPAGISQRPPMLGEHTAEVLESLGYSLGDIDRMSAAGTI
ncbi:MAG: CoA transferase [Pseudomonadota bacterium]